MLGDLTGKSVGQSAVCRKRPGIGEPDAAFDSNE